MLDYTKYSTDQLDYFDELRRYHERNLTKTNYKAKEWITMDAELKPMFTALLIVKKIDLEIMEQTVIAKMSKYAQYAQPYKMMAEELLIIQEGSEIQSLQKQIKWLESGLRTFTYSGELTEAQIDEARDVDVKTLLESEGTRGQYLCPFHEEKTASFHVFSNNSWHCFGCQAHGQNAIDFVMKKEGLTFPKAVRSLIGE